MQASATYVTLSLCLTNILIAGLAVRDPVKQAAVLHLLERTLEVTRFPPKSLLQDLTNHWHSQQ